MDKLIIKGAREHNLKNIDLELPRDKLIVVSGLSGSGMYCSAWSFFRTASSQNSFVANSLRHVLKTLTAFNVRRHINRPDTGGIQANFTTT